MPLPSVLEPLGQNAIRGRYQALRDYNLGLTLAAGMALFTGLGWGVDQYRGKGMIGILVGAGLGVGYMVYELWRLARVDHAAPSGKAEPSAPQPPTKTTDGGAPR